ncbi:peptide chain release factor N(5)-glutamine methyltransferase [Gaoshiqia sediminis]|uniref:Release factor glutamine methyltransferase n=1 Tax=Gaoshiqia sediminis TaxID=2986998 RepID=A0AA41Y9Z1_9BACT|nr:peptide chain release factor N(5)-glutamine methyltransferase [Gaoshiqia sediminis]MCW0484012.1 peptide chain release factor N(5)-glutamine methyltransferase [Gaoshiqia sediminis]
MQASIAYIRKELKDLYPDQEIEGLVRLIFSALRNYTPTDLLLKKNERLTPDEQLHLNEIVRRLKKHEPIQYILGETEFYSLPFQVTEDVLIPRPETEELVDWILKDLTIASPVILDVGTGSGCIPVSLKKFLPAAKVMGCDISEKALKVARANAGINQTEVAFFHLDILNPLLPATFPGLDILVSNPPYVTEKEKQLMQPNVLAHEPHSALFVPDEDPLVFYAALVRFGRQHLKKGGKLFWEINEAFGPACVHLLEENGFDNVQLKKDINGKNRMIAARYV